MKNLKFKRGTLPLNEIIGHAIKLNLKNEPSFTGADCCFIKNGFLSFGEVGSDSWSNSGYTEISEKDFMKLTEKPKKCKEKGCFGIVDFNAPIRLQTGCASFSVAYACGECKRLYWLNNDRISGVKNRRGEKAFAE
jgi:hypothetical protein